MKKNILFVLVILIFGCKDKPTDLPQSQNNLQAGEYRGLYIISDNGKIDSGVVQINFNEHKSYQCIPVKELLPPEGGGFYELVNGDRMRLMDTFNHGSDLFDGSLILNGEFVYKATESTLLITQRDSSHNRLRRLELTKE